MAERANLYATARPTPLPGAVGVDGESYESYTLAYAGGPDVNPALSGRAKYALYNEMRRSDPAISGQLYLQKLPIRQAVWSLEPASTDGEDQLVCDTLARQFGLNGENQELDLSWDQQLQQALLLLDWGAMGEELIWGEPTEWTLDEGKTVYLRPLLRLAPRAPSSIALITENPIYGRIDQIAQDLPGAKPIPGDKLQWFAYEKEGRNWYGNSFMRPLYGPWKLKRSLLVASAIAWDRWASGIPVVRHPVGQEAEAEKIGRSVRTHERAYVRMPNGEEWDFSIENGGQGMADPTPLLRIYDEQIAIRGAAQFSVLGRTATGSRATADVQVQPYYEGLRSLAGQIAGDKMKQTFRQFVDVNFGENYELPKLTFSKLGRLPVDTIAQAAANLHAAGLTFDDRDTQNAIRDILELPDLPENLKPSIDALPDPLQQALTPMSPSVPLAAIQDARRLPREGEGLTPATR